MEVAASEAVIWQYITDLKTISNETGRKERFIVLLCELFPTLKSQIVRFAGGAESYLSVQYGDGKFKKGFVDTLFGNLVIEFETELPKMLHEAEFQLKGYVSQLWSQPSNYTPYLCVATDGINWHVYSPRIDRNKNDSFPFEPDHIDLVQGEMVSLEDRSNIPLFRAWIDRILFRENRLRPDAKVIAAEYGQRGHVFVRAMSRLEVIVHHVQQTPEFKVAFANWARYLRYTYGEVDARPELFLRHSYMSAFAKLLVASMFARSMGRQITPQTIEKVIEGQFFSSLMVQNYCERDFFGWLTNELVISELKDLWFSIYNSLAIYDFDRVESDFLKDIYQQLVDPADRHDLGEYYTPDWLCERLISQLVDSTKGAKKIADITCGSGSFLRAAIVRLRAEEHTNSLTTILDSVVGFEIHPLAVFIAKTNYLIAISDLIVATEKPVSIPVYLCDSLLAPYDSDDLSNAASVRFMIGEKPVTISRRITQSAQLLMDFVDYCDAVAAATLEGEFDPNSLKTEIEGFFLSHNYEASNDDLQSASDMILTLRERKQVREDSIWAYVLKNNLQPYLFKSSFDIIAGNPPWLSFRYIADDSYRQEVEWLGMEKYRVAPRTSSLRTQMELATIFMAHACGYYLKKSGKVGFVMPRSIFSADHHALFREQHRLSGMEISEIWDLQDVKPLFNVPTCVLIATASPAVQKSHDDDVATALEKQEDKNGRPQKATRKAQRTRERRSSRAG